jgi:tetratricopeptide (TPR) repeat protein
MISLSCRCKQPPFGEAVCIVEPANFRPDTLCGLSLFTIQAGCLKRLLMPEFTINDKRHLEAAEGWLGLGSWQEANEELENITPQFRGHPEVLGVRFQIYAKAEKWEHAIEIASAISDLLPENPFGHFHLAYGLHELKRTKEAYDVLIVVVDKFPNEHLIRYNLACYSCRLGNLKEAYQWLERSIDLAGEEDIRQMALDDPDLEQLWNQIAEI